MPEHYPNPAYQSQVDVIHAENAQDYDMAVAPSKSTPEASVDQSDTDEGLSREEVTNGLRKIAAMLALGASIGAFGTAGWLTYEAHEAQTPKETTISVWQGDHSEPLSTYSSDAPRAHELINIRNKLIPLGASALGLALMQGNIAARKSRTES